MKKIGEKFKIDGVNIEVVKAPDSEECTGCYFEKSFRCDLDKSPYACCGDDRADGETVIFKPCI